MGEDKKLQPHDTYYQACVGYWRAPFSITITDRHKLREHYGVLDRLSLWMLAIWPSWLGRAVLYTSVHYQQVNEVVHTTRLRWFFLTMMSSKELIVLDSDGKSFTLDGHGRQINSFWKTRHVHGAGEVEEDTRHADYTLTWLGAPLHQHTVREENQLVLTMEGQGFLGAQPLQRLPGRPDSFR